MSAQIAIEFIKSNPEGVATRIRQLERENAALRAAIKRIHKEWGGLVHAEDNLDDAIWKALAAAEKDQP